MDNYLLKNFIQRMILATSANAREAEMNQAKAEDTEFTGLSSAQSSLEEQVKELLSAMSLDEKITFIGGYKSLGIHAIPRLKLPSVWMTDATSGPRCYGPTAAFPSAIAMAATWDEEVIREAADHIAEATRAAGVSILLGPGVNIARVPTCGRNFEYMGEDPYLAGRLAAAYIQACQNRGVICTVKHLVANNSDYDRHKVSSDMEEAVLREIYLPAFERAVKEGGVDGVMTSYNPLNGTWMSENSKLITSILREEWGFQGFVVSDWNSLYSTLGPVKAGLDLEMPRGKWLSHKRLKKALQKGQIQESEIDAMVQRLLNTLFRAGVYQRPTINPQARRLHSDHDEAALRCARRGLVLLKNTAVEGAPLLPLKEGWGQTIVLCGPNASESAILGGGSCYVATTTGTISLEEGLKQEVAPGTTIITIPYRPHRPSLKDRRAFAAADVVILACGFNHVEESECYDRSWELPKGQRRLIHAASEQNPRCCVILTSGGGVETKSWAHKIPALIHGLYLGQSVGRATAQIILGRYNPTGRLPFTMAQNWEDIPATANYPRRYTRATPGRIFLGQGNPHVRSIRHWKYKEGLLVGYRGFDALNREPAFAFGHGLSYGKMAMKLVKTDTKTLSSNQSLSMTVEIENLGTMTDTAVVQAYIEGPTQPGRPPRELKGFCTQTLEAGKKERGILTLHYQDFRRWGKQGWTVLPGTYTIYLGTSSRTFFAHATLEIQ